MKSIYKYYLFVWLSFSLALSTLLNSLNITIKHINGIKVLDIPFTLVDSESVEYSEFFYLYIGCNNFVFRRHVENFCNTFDVTKVNCLKLYDVVSSILTEYRVQHKVGRVDSCEFSNNSFSAPLFLESGLIPPKQIKINELKVGYETNPSIIKFKG